jgi:hypothetical protein
MTGDGTGQIADFRNGTGQPAPAFGGVVGLWIADRMRNCGGMSLAYKQNQFGVARLASGGPLCKTKPTCLPWPERAGWPRSESLPLLSGILRNKANFRPASKPGGAPALVRVHPGQSSPAGLDAATRQNCGPLLNQVRSPFLLSGAAGDETAFLSEKSRPPRSWRSEAGKSPKMAFLREKRRFPGPRSFRSHTHTLAVWISDPKTRGWWRARMPSSWGSPGMLVRCAGHSAAGGGSPIAMNRDWDSDPPWARCIGSGIRRRMPTAPRIMRTENKFLTKHTGSRTF